MCRVHRAPRGEQGARKGGVISRHPPLVPWGPCLECSREVSPRGLPLLENQVLSTAHASARATSSGRKVACTAYVAPTATPLPPPTNQFARQVAGPVRGRGRGRAPNTEETAYSESQIVFLV